MIKISYVASVNAGSSSLKFKLFKMPHEEVVASVVIERIGNKDSIVSLKYLNQKHSIVMDIRNHEEASFIVLETLLEHKLIINYHDIDIIGHRIVHGGDYFNCPVIIDDKVTSLISKLSIFAPLHNPINLNVYFAFSKHLSHCKHIAVFDTAFHQTISESNYLYPIPSKYYEEYRIRKYGFHGISHEYITSQLKKIINREDISFISCHLGNGASISAIENGKCINTSMGFTPLAGLMMGTRSGDIDPAIIPTIANLENISTEQVIFILNNQSGIKGVSNLSNDMRDIEAAIEEGNKKALLALEMFTRRIASMIASYMTELTKIDAIVFTAGIGENDDIVRKMVVERLKSIIYIELDEKLNKTRGQTGIISKLSSKIPIYIIPTDEELSIAIQSYKLMSCIKVNSYSRIN